MADRTEQAFRPVTFTEHEARQIRAALRIGRERAVESTWPEDADLMIDAMHLIDERLGAARNAS